MKRRPPPSTKKPRVETKKSERVSEVPRLADFRNLNLSCTDWEYRIEHHKSLMPAGLLAALDQERANKALQVFNRLRLPDVAEQPTLEEAAGDWFKEIVQATFGSWNGEDRGINEFFVLVPKKNSKTTNAAGIMTTAMIRSERPRAEFLLVAPTQAVSSIAFNQALGMIENDPELLEMCQIQDYMKKITFLPNKCSLKIKSFDPSILTGSKPAGVLLDELHVIAEHRSADRVLGQIRGGMISQPEAFLMTITTQSERVPSGVFRTELMKARKVRDGTAKLKMLPILYEFPDKFIRDKDDPRRASDVWKNPKYWSMVTPNVGRSITIARLKEDYASAIVSEDKDELSRWASQHLNIEIGLALRTNSWVGAKLWLTAGIPLTLEQLIERSTVITLGIDGGGLDDLLGFTVCGRDTEGRWLTWSKAWMHKIAMERRKSEAAIYKDLIKDGDLVLVENVGEDVTQLGDLVEQVVLSGKLDKIGVDPSGLGLILDELENRGVRGPDSEKSQIVGISQGWRLMSAIKTAERKIAEKVLLHADQPLMRWCVENARVEPRGNAILITKQISGTAKIDPLMALFNAVELMAANPVGEPKYQMMFIGGN